MNAKELLKILADEIKSAKEGNSSLSQLNTISRASDAMSRIALGQLAYQTAQGKHPDIDFFKG
jgi:hypothetical protein